MTRFKITMTAALLASTVALQGCTTNADGSPANIFSDISMVSSNQELTPEQRALRNRDRSYASARLTGAAVGAVMGGVLCSLSNCSTEQTVAAMGVGGVAGYVGTAYLARDNQSFVASQESLQADIAQAREESGAMREDVRLAQAVLDQQRRQTTELRNAYRAGKITQAQMTNRLQVMRQDIAAVEETRTNAETRVAALGMTSRSYRDQGFNASQLNATAADQRAYVEQLRRIERAMIGTVDTAAGDLTS
jgi:hypothetical protein